ncbi:probable metal-nicotianamine transporter YSL7 [Dioscorea cayenensis subsp. rotundata]|uniref:Probable metal-nicotianamine transporter YSL7 n=1 Tax=Dioscorea cayennensis subsp. rotundata TaxID=55577 RepID=A0AB40AYK7_DIOCR|nr:probable metal-nicotianamine transporter YSL7 [Dioscorea cayenensis subsp. rotundata]
MFSVIVMKLNLTSGIIPSLNISPGLLGFFFLKGWTKIVEKLGFSCRPFTRQENTVVQTCVVAAAGIAFSGGFGSYLFAMSDRIANQSTELNKEDNIKNPGLGWMIAFLFYVSFLGLFSLMPLRKIMIIDYKLRYPSGTVTAHLINSFHTPQGAVLAKKQVATLGKFFFMSFFWGVFQWFYSAGDDCGFKAFPTLGINAYKRKFYFDFSATYIGVGMICPHLINFSVLFGGIISWGILWPLIEKKKGYWFAYDLHESSVKGLQGYRISLAIGLMLGDGIYNFLKVLYKTIVAIITQIQSKGFNSRLPISDDDAPSFTCSNQKLSYDEQRRTEVFLKDGLPNMTAITFYFIISLISTAALSHIFPQLKWYYILLTYALAPIFAFCNAYGCGLTDWSVASTYGKLAIFIIGSLSGLNGGVIAGLAGCGAMFNIVSTASDIIQDFKTGYMTLASPRAMFISQVIGTAMGCLISPTIFWLFYKGLKDVGVPGSEFSAPYALAYRNMAVLGAEGFSSLPKHCLTLSCAFFFFAILINIIRDHVGVKIAMFIPIPMAMAIPFYLGSNFAIDMCIGGLILFIWQKVNKPNANMFASAVASGLVCGEGIWALPQAILSLVNLKPPICMKFLSRDMNEKVDEYIHTLS